MRLICCLLAVTVAFASAQTVPNFKNGRKVIVHLFEWKWTDIAAECERYLGMYGFAGVQISPPSEHNEVWSPWRPWYERYQPIGYGLNSRSGNEAEFADMVRRCRDVDVLIYVDAVINHMAAFDYYFPLVPYHSTDFNVPSGNCKTGNDMNYGNAESVRNCDLVGLNDLRFGAQCDYYTNDKVIEYLNKMIDYGVAGFRIDAAKHMWPGDLWDIVGGLKNTWDGSRPYVFQEVIDRSGSEAVSCHEYTGIGDVTEFKYCDKIVGIGRGNNLAKYFSNFGEAWGMMNTDSAFVFVDNHDNQRSHGGGGDILTYKESTPYKKALAFGMAWDYGTFRIMSSFEFSDPDSSPPANSDGSTQSPYINADSTCGGGWVCEHRWRQIRNMACFRNAAGWEPVLNFVDNGNNAIGFSRGNRAYFALNNEGYTVTGDVYTGLPAGEYCDVISGDPTNSGCTGRTVTVKSDGRAWLSVDPGEDSMVAFHIGAMAGSGSGCRW
ncbi:alpha-amylase 2-like [Lytechinus pictus]|uniref:alpha-amylase 2-like n=1 Tax=Lytechinus pictus TaxID=7653 RepID=UPI0030B9FCCA